MGSQKTSPEFSGNLAHAIVDPEVLPRTDGFRNKSVIVSPDISLSSTKAGPFSPRWPPTCRALPPLAVLPSFPHRDVNAVPDLVSVSVIVPFNARIVLNRRLWRAQEPGRAQGPRDPGAVRDTGGSAASPPLRGLHSLRPPRPPAERPAGRLLPAFPSASIVLPRPRRARHTALYAWPFPSPAPHLPCTSLASRRPGHHRRVHRAQRLALSRRARPPSSLGSQV